MSAVNLAERAVLEHELDSYFGYLYPIPAGVLVSSGSSLFRFGQDGRIVWLCRSLGVDGVVVHDVRDGVVVGAAELDPPGEWKPFRVALADGSRLA